MKSRSLKSVILNKSQHFSGRIIILTGARQTGKTTLARKTFPEMKYIPADDPVMIDQYTSLSAPQWNDYYPHAILDEVQKAPTLIETIKSVYDQYDETNYILTGSSQLLLLNKVRESLAGRCIIFELYPLTIPELITNDWDDEIRLSLFQQLLLNESLPDLLPSFLLYPDHSVRENSFRYYITNGGYPALIKTKMKDEERFEWLTNFIRTYLERDVRDLADFRSLEPFVKIQRLTSLMTGNLLNFSELARDAGITANTARRFISYLEISYQAILLQPWSRNKFKRLVKSPKIHYLDPGVQKAIVQKRGIPTGNEFESAVIAELYKQMKSIQYPGSFYHLHTADGREVDLLIETEKGYYAFEIKITGRAGEPDTRHLRSLEQILDKPLLKSFLLTNDPLIHSLKGNILAIPAAMFLS